MAIARVTQGTEDFQTAANSWSVDGVASPGATDVVILGILTNSGNAPTAAPTGFTQIGSPIVEPGGDFTTALYWKVNATGPYVVNFAGNEQGVGFWISYSGMDNTTPIDVAMGSASSGGTGSTVVDTPSITPVTSGAKIVGIATTESSVTTTMTWDAPIVEALDVYTASGTPDFGVWVGDKDWTSGAVQMNGDISTSRGTTKITLALRPAQAAVEVAQGTFAANTTTGAQSVTGLSFQPKVVLFWGVARTATGYGTGLSWWFGAATSATNEWSLAGCSDNAAATSNTGRSDSGSASITILSDGTPTVDGLADFTSFNGDGFTINWSNAPTSAYIIHYLAIGGSDITNVKAGSFAPSTSTGNKATTDPGFQPDFVLLGTINGVADTTSTGDSFALGFASGTTQRGCVAFRDADASAAALASTSQRTNRCLAMISTSTEIYTFEDDFASFDANGFTINRVAGSSTNTIRYLAIKGGEHFVGAETQKGSTGTKSTTGVGFTPKALMSLSWNLAASAAIDSTTAKASVSAATAAAESGVWLQSADTADPTDVDQRVVTDKALGLSTQPSTTDAEADLSSFDSDGFTLNYTTDGGGTRQFLYWAIGVPSPATVGVERIVRWNVRAAVAAQRSLRWDVASGARITLIASLAETTGTGPYTVPSAGTFIPAAGAMLGVFVALPAHTNFGQATVTDSLALASGGVNFVRDPNQPRFDAAGDASNGSLYFFLADRPAAAVARTLAIAIGDDPAEGCLVAVVQIKGMTKGGATGIRQVQIQNLSVAGGTPSMTLPSAPLTTSVILGAVANRANPAALTPPGSYNEFLDTGIATPSTGLHVVGRDGGETSSTITWGSSSATAKACFLVELDLLSADPMPTGNLPGWNLKFNEDFTTDAATWGTCSVYGTGVPPDRRCASLPAAYVDRWWARPTSYLDTREKLTADGGFYTPANMSMEYSFMRSILRRVSGTSQSTAAIPLINGAAHEKQTYGRYAVRFWTEPSSEFKLAWLLWREEETWGEIDYPEADLNGNISAFNHHEVGQASFSTSTPVAGQWHTAVIEWKPGSVEFFLDGVSIGADTGAGNVPSTAMSWVLQSETRMGGAAPPSNVGDVAVLVDWVAVWSYDPTEPPPPPVLATSGSGTIVTLPVAQPELDGLFALLDAQMGTIRCVLNGRRAPLSISATDSPFGGHNASTPEAFRLTNVDGLNDAEVVDARDPRGDIGEMPFLATYGGRNLVFTGIIDAFNLTQLRGMEDALKKAMVPRYSDVMQPFFATIRGFRSQLTPLVYITPDLSSFFGATTLEQQTKMMAIYGNVVDFKMGEVQDSDRYRREFQFTFRCPDPRWYAPRAENLGEPVVLTPNAASTTIRNEGNVHYEPIWRFGDFSSSGGNAAWSINANGFRLTNHTTQEEVCIESAQSTVSAGHYVHIDTREKRIVRSTDGVSLLTSVPPAFQQPWVSLAPGNNSVQVTGVTILTGAPKMHVYKRHTFI